MIAWLTDTLVMTGAIMALILVVRRPVGRWFGPSAAYALWALPMIRLVLPPLVLPESLAIASTAEGLVQRPEVAGEALTATMVFDAGSAGATAAAPLFDLPWGSILLAVWLGGAALFLAHRAISYRSMRRELLRDVRSIGRSGKIRIVESPEVDAPVAFGVFDRVVALPLGFLAAADSDVSDFAITHELEHHAGNDLLANIAVQPLFALHWFNPLAWVAWRALRSDQEAACDARVMAGRSRVERECYGRLIASFAAGSKFAMAAPMAGPLRGDKPIIHRLKALVRNEVPERHRILGRSMFAASVIAVPLTASVTYAAVDPDEPVATAFAETGPTSVEPPTAAQSPLECEAPAAAAPATVPGLAAGARRITHASTAGQTAASHATKWASAHPLAATDALALSAGVDEADATRIQADNAQAQADKARAWAVKAQAQAEKARAQAEGARRDGERAAAESQRIVHAAAARATRAEWLTSGGGLVRTLRLVTPSSHGEAAVTRTMVIDATCAADEPSQARSVSGGSETYVCSGTPHAPHHAVVALSRARASVAANTHLRSQIRQNILSRLDRQIAVASAEAD